MSHPHVHERQLFPQSIFQDFPAGLHNHWGLDSKLQWGPGDHGYYKKVKVRGQRKVERVFSAWGFEHHLSCNLPSVYQELRFETLKYFYAWRFF